MNQLPDRVKENDFVAGRQGEDLAVPGHLHAANLVRGCEFPDLRPGGGVPHPDSFVIAAADQRLVVGGVHHLDNGNVSEETCIIVTTHKPA